jgi:hypothetical protein
MHLISHAVKETRWGFFSCIFLRASVTSNSSNALIWCFPRPTCPMSVVEGLLAGKGLAVYPGNGPDLAARLFHEEASS